MCISTFFDINLDLRNWTIRKLTCFKMKMVRVRLTDAVSRRTAWVQHPKHTERWQPQWGVSVPHSHPLTHPSFPHLRVSHPGNTSRSLLRVVWRVHYWKGSRALWFKRLSKMHFTKQAKYPGLSKKLRSYLFLFLLFFQSTSLGGFRACRQLQILAFCLKKIQFTAPPQKSQAQVLHCKDSTDCTGTPITKQQLPRLLLHFNSLSLFPCVFL